MITATVEDTQMGKWTVLECQHPVKSGRHLILRGKFRTRTELLSACGQRFYLGPMTRWDELADKVEEHEKSHDPRGKDQGDGSQDRGPGEVALENTGDAPAARGSHGDASRGNGGRHLASVERRDHEDSGESPGES